MCTRLRCTVLTWAVWFFCASSLCAQTADDIASLVRGNNGFAYDLYRQLLDSPSDNLIASPYSISNAMGMVWAGARGQTEREIADVFGFELGQDRLHPAYGALVRDLKGPDRNGYELAIANRLWGQQGYSLKPPFVATTRDHYGAELAQLDFIRDADGSRRTINGWVEQQTRDRIQELIPPGALNDQTRLVLTNAIYFLGEWKYAFDPGHTATLPFNVGAGEQMSVPMMTQTSRLRYADGGDFGMLELPYTGDDLSMLIVLPKAADGLAAVESRLNADVVQAAIDSLSIANVTVHLPRFEVAAEFALKGTLSAMGMPGSFQDGADFSGIADDRLAISEVRHKAFIQLNEVGTEAAASTSIEIGITSVDPTPFVAFDANHPFHFLIRDNETSSFLFMGRVLRPDASTAAVPEPASVVLGVIAALGLLAACRRQRLATGGRASNG